VLKKPFRKKRKKNHSGNNRIVPIHLFDHVVDIPYGGRLCGTHLNRVYLLIAAQQSLADELNTVSGIHSFEMEYDKYNELDKVNMLLTSLGESPLKSQVTMPLDEQTPGAIRRVVAKFRQTVAASGNFPVINSDFFLSYFTSF
jgi:hypothetical protein